MSEGTLQNAAGNAAAPRIDDPPSEEAASVALEWRRTTVAGRRATFGVGGDGPPVVFLHGWALSGRTYRNALSRLLALPLRVLAPALPGFGGTTSLAPNPAIADYAYWVAQFVESVGIEEPAVVMGHSFGGAVAIKLAPRLPHEGSRPRPRQLGGWFGVARERNVRAFDGGTPPVGLGHPPTP